LPRFAGSRLEEEVSVSRELPIDVHQIILEDGSTGLVDTLGVPVVVDMIVDSDPHGYTARTETLSWRKHTTIHNEEFHENWRVYTNLTYQHQKREFLSKVRLFDEEWNAIADDIVAERTVYDEKCSDPSELDTNLALHFNFQGRPSAL